MPSESPSDLNQVPLHQPSWRPETVSDWPRVPQHGSDQFETGWHRATGSRGRASRGTGLCLSLVWVVEAGTRTAKAAGTFPSPYGPDQMETPWPPPRAAAKMHFTWGTGQGKGMVDPTDFIANILAGHRISRLPLLEGSLQHARQVGTIPVLTHP